MYPYTILAPTDPLNVVTQQRSQDLEKGGSVVEMTRRNFCLATPSIDDRSLVALCGAQF